MTALFLMTFWLLVGCRDYREIALKSKSEIKEVAHFTTVFEKHSVKISYYQGIGEGKYLRMRGLSYNRYLSECYFPIDLIDVGNPMKVGELLVAIYELSPHGESGFTRSRLGEIDEVDFMRIQSPEEVFRFIGLNPTLDAPVKNIDTYLEDF